MGVKESRDYRQIKQVLMTLSMDEIPRCLDIMHIDVNHPPSDFSPLHHLVECTFRERILLELMEMYDSSPFLSFQGATLLHLACRTKKEMIVEAFFGKVRGNNRKQQAVVEREIDLYPDDRKRSKLRELWMRRLRNGCRMFVIMLIIEGKGMRRLGQNLAWEVVMCI